MTETAFLQDTPTAAKRMFAADLHHPGGRYMPIEQLFDSMPETVEQVFLLGDTFDYWINDEDFIEEYYGAFLQRLRRLAAGGVDLFFVEGNRDFLARDYFEGEDWIDVLPNPSVIDLDGRIAYIGHGDELCWNDYRYQIYKAIIRSKPMRFIADHRPNRWKRRIVRRMAAKSAEFVAAKSQRQLAVPQRAYARMISMGMDVVIHGHVHRSYQHQMRVGEREGAILTFGWQDGKRNVIML